MKEILVIEGQLELKKYFSEIEEKNNNFFYFDGNLGEINSYLDRDQFFLIIIDFILFDEYREIFSEKKIPLVFSFNKDHLEEKNLNGLYKSCVKNKSVIGILDISIPSSLNLPLFRSFNYILKDTLNFETTSEINKRLSTFETFYEKDLKSIKNLHKKLIPLRKEKIKGILISSKFLAGMASGGEFFDIKKEEGQLVVYLTSANSYYLSSLCLGFFDHLKKTIITKKEDLFDYFGFVEKSILSAKQSNLKLQIGVFIIDLSTYKLWGASFGKTFFKSTKTNFLKGNDYFLSREHFDKSFFSFSLERSEKVFIFSPGFKKSSCKLLNDGQINKILEEGENSDDLINEFFFQIKRENLESEFLEFDSSILCLEVDSNAIMQV